MPTEQELAACVMEYLTGNPKAADTLEGIAEWWIMRQQIRIDVELLAKVLASLTEKGLLASDGLGKSTRYYLPRKQEE